jgi:hypothetical protein
MSAVQRQQKPVGFAVAAKVAVENHTTLLIANIPKGPKRSFVIEIGFL